MINKVFEIAAFGYSGILLFMFLFIMRKEQKREPDTQFYWGSRVQEKLSLKYNTSNFFSECNISIGIILLLTIIFWILGRFGFLDISKGNNIIPISRMQEVVVADLTAISAFSLVIVLKKKFYLGISIQDVLKNTFLPETMQFLSINSVIMLLGIGLCRLRQIDPEIKEVLIITVHTTYLLWICNLLYLFCKIASLFCGTTKSELRTFNVLRYRINACYQIENKNIIDEVQVDAISEYLFKKIKKSYTRLMPKKKGFDKVEIQSIEIYKNMWINMCGSVGVFAIVAVFVGLGWFMHCLGKTGVPIRVDVILTAITAGVYIFGLYKNIWLIIGQDKFFYVFKQSDKKKIVMRGFNPIWKKRYELIGNIQDMLGLYKILLDNDVEKKKRDIVVQRLKDVIDMEPLKNVLEILFLYLEYEQFLKRRNIDSEIEAPKCVIKSINNIIKKEKLITYNKKIDHQSFVYTFCNAILSEIFKQPKIENGTKNYRKLENVKFDSMVDFINKQFVS